MGGIVGARYDWRAGIEPLKRSKPGIDWDFARAKYDAWREEKRHPDTLARWLRFAGNERAPPMRQMTLDEHPAVTHKPHHWAIDDAQYRAARAAAVPMPIELQNLLRPIARASPSPVESAARSLLSG